VAFGPRPEAAGVADAMIEAHFLHQKRREAPSFTAGMDKGSGHFQGHVMLGMRHEESMWSPPTERLVLGWNVRWGLHIDLA
jgi:hypothetical protein